MTLKKRNRIIAIVVCAIIFISYAMILGFLGFERGGGFIGFLIFYLALYTAWEKLNNLPSKKKTTEKKKEEQVIQATAGKSPKYFVPDTIIEHNPISDLPPIPQDDTQEKMQAYHPRMHWIVKIILAFGILGIIINVTGLIISKSVTIDTIIFYTWALVSILGIFNKKKWGLISYFSYRALGLIAIFVAYFPYLDYKELFYTGLIKVIIPELIGLIIVLSIFFIKKDGYNVYQLLWHNGVIYKPQETAQNND